jgi:hypothetical protein
VETERKFVLVARNEAVVSVHSYTALQSERIRETVVDCLGHLSGMFHVWITPGLRENSAEIRIRQPHGLSSTVLVEVNISPARLMDRLINCLVVADPIAS